jgi:3',5'-cyclic AMP phosphodiesterase CpdA
VSDKTITRRDMLRLGAGTMLALGLWPGRLRGANAPASGNFTFLVVNDLHFTEPACAPWFAEAVKQMKASAPEARFCLVCGDLVQDGRREQFVGARGALDGLGIPYYVTIGNHDFAADNSRVVYDQLFPGRNNYSFEHDGWQFVGLDTSEGTKFLGATISASTLGWLDRNLPLLSQKKPTIVFTHFPLNAGLLQRPLNADALLEKFLNFNLQAAFCGHWHGYTEARFHSADLLTNRCCSRIHGNHDGTKEKGWFVCEVKNGVLSRRFVEVRLGS